MTLLNVDRNAKTIKGRKEGYMTGILYLAPYTLAGIGNVCPNATPGCTSACLYTAGRGGMHSTQAARIRKTKLFKQDQPFFLAQLVKEITSLARRAKKANLIPVVRLNGTSDLPWENMGVMEQFPDVQFYDYTKSERRMLAFREGRMPRNYHLTFSRSEYNDAACKRVLSLNGNVAVVFEGALPKQWHGYPVTDGDKNDLRFLDTPGTVIGLHAKGAAGRDRTGFVVRG